jgi:amidase
MSELLRISKEHHVFHFDANAEPVVVVDPGTIFEIQTWDCYTGQVTSEDDTHRTINNDLINSATGPIGIRGAEPGDSLSVTLLDIQPDEIGSAMCQPEWGQLGHHVKDATRMFKVKDGVVTMNDRVSFPSSPMFGVIGVSPASGSISTMPAGQHGGNMDNNLHGIGATIHLPVFQPGAQLGIGDMHASMGDGEICGTGVEIGGIGTIKVDLIKGKHGNWPVTETADSIITHGTAEDINEAMSIACEEAYRLLVDEWSFTPEDAFIYLSVAGDLGVAQNVHPCPGTVIAKMKFKKIAAVPRPFRL